MSKILAVNDLHFADRPPSSCTDSYTEDLLSLAGETVAVAEQYQVSAVVWTGDVFHSKTPRQNSHRLVQRVIGIGHAYDRPWYIVPGNHDLQHDDLGSIHETQPLGVLYRAGARALLGQCREFPYLWGVPWQQEWSDQAVEEALAGYNGSPALTGGHHCLVAAHAPLYPPGHELPYENYPARQWAQAMGGKGSCVYGHVHEYHGAWQEGGVTFCNPGALSRGSLHEYNLRRTVQVVVWDSADGSFTEVPLQKARPAEEIFRLREKQQVVDAAGKLDDFLSSIGSAQFEVLSAEAVLAHVNGLDIDQGVKDEVAELLDWAAHQS